MQSNEQLALDNCSREPVHRPGRTQSFAAILVFDSHSFEILAHTANLQSFIGVEGNEKGTYLGSDLRHLFTDRHLIHAIRGALGLPTIRVQRERLGPWEVNSHRYDLAVHLVARLPSHEGTLSNKKHGDELGILELEQTDSSGIPLTASVIRVRTMLSGLENHHALTAFLQSAVKTLRRLTGFDRIMCYKFLPDDAGEVVAEAAAPGVDSFLGLRYPAYDIPSQVRKLALQVPVRVIADIADPHSELVNALNEPIDLTYCYSRGVSPIHAEYLTNMGVRASMNLSIIVGGKLWGLFAFHHDRPRRLPPEIRAVAELFGHFFSIQLTQELENRSLEGRNRALLFRQELKTHRYDSITSLLNDCWQDLVELVEADGLAFVSDEAVLKFGQTPSTSQTIRSIATRCAQEVTPIESLVALPTVEGGLETESDLNDIAGVLSVIIDDVSRTRLLFFRRELVSEVRWAGMPEKRIEFGPNGPRLFPRASFEEYRETVSGRCAPWTQTDLRTAGELRIAMLEAVFHDTLTARNDWRKQKDYQDLLIAELNHRVKNILSLVRSIALQTKDSADSLEDFMTAFDKRIAALVSAHELIGGSGMQWAGLEQLFEAELRPFLHSHHDIKLNGLPVALREDITPVVSLVIHELVSNAVKYGVLSSDKGRLEVSWSSDASGLSIHWREHVRGKPVVQNRAGFGLRLIERAFPHECGGRSSVSFHERGLEANFWLPP